MQVTYVADSTFLFEHEGLRILTDPWIGSTIYGGSWQQYPPPVIKAEDLGHLNYIFISHVHEDHCDPATLAKLDKNATIITMDRRPNFVENFLKKIDLRFKDILKIKAFEPKSLGLDLKIEIIDADPSHRLNHLLD